MATARDPDVRIRVKGLKFSNPAGRAGVRKLLARNKFRTS
jgi:hypothetical protein